MARAIASYEGDHLVRASNAPRPDLRSYDTIIVAFSGGKDSIACLLSLIEAGVPRTRIELHHHDVDGQGPSFMDWPSTTSYCRSVARALEVPLYLSWKAGGFLREMLRDDAATAAVYFEAPNGSVQSVGGQGPPGTRLWFPQVSADLRHRWCSELGLKWSLQHLEGEVAMTRRRRRSDRPTASVGRASPALRASSAGRINGPACGPSHPHGSSASPRMKTGSAARYSVTAAFVPSLIAADPTWLRSHSRT